MLDRKETREQAQQAKYTYLTADGFAILATGSSKIFSVFWKADGGVLLLFADNEGTDQFFQCNMDDGGSFYFGPNGLDCPEGLSALISGETACAVTVTHTP